MLHRRMNSRCGRLHAGYSRPGFTAPLVAAGGSRQRQRHGHAPLHAVTTDNAGPSSSAPQPSSSSSSSLHGRVKLRLCRLQDVPAVAAICGEAFGFGNFPGIDNASLQELEERYAVTIEKEMTVKLGEALTRKAEAAAQHRAYRLQRQAQMLRAQLAVLEGRKATFPGPEGPDQLRQIQKWRRARMYACLLAVDAASGQVLGCVTASLTQPEAVLPPPFPSSAPLRLYCSNMAVAGAARRRGVARLLLQQCARIGRLWGWDSMWLHVGAVNAAAQALYLQSGFRVINPGPPLPGPMRQVLLHKPLPPLRLNSNSNSTLASVAGAGSRMAATGVGSGAAAAGMLPVGSGAGVPAPLVVGGRKEADGVFVWEAIMQAEAEGEPAGGRAEGRLGAAADEGGTRKTE